MPDPLSPKDEPIASTATLRLIRKVVALTTPEAPVSLVEYGATTIALGAQEPGPSAAKVLIGVGELDPRRFFAEIDGQPHAVIIDDHTPRPWSKESAAGIQ